MTTAIQSPEMTTLRFRATHSSIDYLTALAIFDKSTIAAQGRDAIDDFLQVMANQDVRITPVEPRKLIRKGEMQVDTEVLTRMGALASDQLLTVDQALHEAFSGYIDKRLAEIRLSTQIDAGDAYDPLPIP